MCVIMPCTLNTISSCSATSVVDVTNFQHFGCSLYVGLKRSICVRLRGVVSAGLCLYTYVCDVRKLNCVVLRSESVFRDPL
jgi:hypothetical protein